MAESKSLCTRRHRYAHIVSILTTLIGKHFILLPSYVRVTQTFHGVAQPLRLMFIQSDVNNYYIVQYMLTLRNH